MVYVKALVKHEHTLKNSTHTLWILFFFAEHDHLRVEITTITFHFLTRSSFLFFISLSVSEQSMKYST